MSMAMIVAMTRKRVIGKAGGLPWYMADDLKLFFELTLGQTVIMGLNTYNSIGRPLPGRHNIVLDREDKDIAGVDVCRSINQAMAKAGSYRTETFVIGGASVYEQMLPMVDTLHISHIKKNYEGSIYFPDIKMSDWRESGRDEYDEFTAITYLRIHETQPVSA